MMNEEVISLAKKVGYQKGINEACGIIREKFDNAKFYNVDEVKAALYETLIKILEKTNETTEAES